MQNDIPSTVMCSKSKPEIEFQYGGHLFSKSKIVIYQLDWLILWNLVCWWKLTLQKCDITRSETGSKIALHRPLSCKSI